MVTPISLNGAGCAAAVPAVSAEAHNKTTHMFVFTDASLLSCILVAESAMVSSQPLSTIDLAQVAVEGSERRVPCLPSDLHQGAIGESNLGMLPTLRDGGGDGLGVLHRQVFVVQQHLDSGRDCLGMSI